jgi:hypothetical protein
MPMSAQVIRYTGENYLKPLFPEKTKPRGVNLAPNAFYPPGSVLIPSAGTANDVQTITPPGAGTYTLSGVNPISGAAFTTAPLAFNATDAAVQAALATVLGAGNVAVAGLAVTFQGALAGQAVPLMTASAGTVAHTTTGSTALQLANYNAAGAGTPTCLNCYACATDGAGNVTFGGQAGGAYLTGATWPGAMAYFGGSFATTDLVGLDANAVTRLGRLASGTIANGILEIAAF